MASGRPSVIALRLNAHGGNVRKIAEYLQWAQQTVRETIGRWHCIEDEWLHLKRDELACQVFADEYDLALAMGYAQPEAIATGLESRAARAEYTVERFRCN